MNKKEHKLDVFKKYFLVPLIPTLIIAVMQCGAYYLGSFINSFYKEVWYVNIKLPLDDKIPFVVGFSWVYLFGVGFNVAMASFVINLLIGRKAVHMLVVLEGSCFLVCFLCFIVIPSPNTLTDNVPPTGSGASWWLYSTIIAPDAVNNANNMPSIHIVFLIAILLVSFSFIKKNVRTICMQSLSVVLFVTVSLSVLFVKQHFILDVIVAIILAIIFYIVFRFTKVFENNNLLFERMYLKMHLSNPKNVSR